VTEFSSISLRIPAQLYLSPSFTHTLSLSVCVCVCLSLPLTLSLCVCAWVSVCLSVCPLPLSLSLSLSHFPHLLLWFTSLVDSRHTCTPLRVSVAILLLFAMRRTIAAAPWREELEAVVLAHRHRRLRALSSTGHIDG